MLTLPNPKKKTMLPISTLEKLEGQLDSGIFKVREEIHVALFPVYLNNIQVGLINYLNKQINHWHPKLEGILAGYGPLKLRHSTGSMSNEESHIHLDVIADFWIFRPVVGAQLKGIVTKKSASHVSCLVHGVFNVPCHRPVDLDSEEQWIGSTIPIGKCVRFTVIKTDMSQKVPFILGNLESDEYFDPGDDLGGQITVVKTEDWANELKRTSSELQRVEKQDEHDSGIDSNEKKSKRKRKREQSEHDDASEISSAAKRIRASGDESSAQPNVEEPEVKHKKKKNKKDKDRERETEHFEETEEKSIEKKKKHKKKKEADIEEPPQADLEDQKMALLQNVLAGHQKKIKTEQESPKRKDKSYKSSEFIERSKSSSESEPTTSQLSAEQQREQLLNNVTFGKSPKKKKKNKEKEREETLAAEMPLPVEKAKKKKRNKKEMPLSNLEAAPSFMVPTSTPTIKTEHQSQFLNVEHSKDDLISNMLAKFEKKSKKKKSV